MSNERITLFVSTKSTLATNVELVDYRQVLHETTVCHLYNRDLVDALIPLVSTPIPQDDPSVISLNSSGMPSKFPVQRNIDELDPVLRFYGHGTIPYGFEGIIM
jgi:hypothetical protein